MEHGLDFLHDGRDAACIIEKLCGPFACGADIQEIVGAAVHPVKGVRIDFQAELMGHCRDVQQGIGGAGNSRVNHDRVFKGFHCYDITYLQPCFNQFHYLSACFIGHLLQLRAGGGHQR